MNGEDIDALHRIGNGAIVDLDEAIETLKQMRQVRAEHRALLRFKPTERVSFKLDGVKKIGFVLSSSDKSKVLVCTQENNNYFVDPFDVETT